MVGTTNHDAATSGIPAKNQAIMWYTSYAMVNMTLGPIMNENGDTCGVTTCSISYAIGNVLIIPVSAYEKNYQDARTTWAMGAIGAMSMTYATGEASGCSPYR